MGCNSSTAANASGPGGAPAKGEIIEVSYFGQGHGRVDPIKQMLDHSGAKWKFMPETFESWVPRK